ncbi:DUF1697 domain-containing protein [Glaciihabitans sp. dw_435]|uniref:DUF1697 domain-containing protein n=1 Tax=Glaciihabitans sp. dw_435 TaxID=2720081 RepID=UPI001BD66A5C|nr:DUF1697 domain-containing protein [Glaciihabitans sp. dw_435]
MTAAPKIHPSRYVALLRGINVGASSRIAMADLRSLVEGLGYTGVRTLLQSGNVVFDSDRAVDVAAREALEAAIVSATGVTSKVLVVDEARFRRIASANPLLDVGTDDSRLIVTFVDEVPDAGTLSRPSDDELLPERIVFGAEAIYQWLPDGVLKTRLPPRFHERLGRVATARNWRTVTKIVDLLNS